MRWEGNVKMKIDGELKSKFDVNTLNLFANGTNYRKFEKNRIL